MSCWCKIASIMLNDQWSKRVMALQPQLSACGQWCAIQTATSLLITGPCDSLALSLGKR